MLRFKSLDEFAVYLKKVNGNYPHLEIEALDAMGEALTESAKEKFGVYQRSGLYQYWKELSDDTKIQRENLGYAPNEPLLRDGDLRDSIKYQTGEKSVTVYSDNEIMVWQELGTPDSEHPIPPRSVLGLTAFHALEICTPILLVMLKAWLMNEHMPSSIPKKLI